MMKNTNKFKKFVNHIKKPLTKENMTTLFNSKNVKYERCELYHDFLQSLIVTIFDTYLGDEYTKQHQREIHFQWCWTKVINDFEAEGIIFKPCVELYRYFLTFFTQLFYNLITKRPLQDHEKDLSSLWEYIFNYNTLKTRADIDRLVEVYQLFDKSLLKS